jgi:hypothetical protein
MNIGPYVKMNQIFFLKIQTGLTQILNYEYVIDSGEAVVRTLDIFSVGCSLY